MKKFTKICLIAGGVCVLAGGGIATVAYAMGARIEDVPIYYGNSHGWPSEKSRQELQKEIQDGIDEVMGDIDDTFGEAYYDWHGDDDFHDYDSYHHNSGSAGIPDGEGKQFSAEYARKLDLEVRWGNVEIREDESAEEISVYSDADESRWTMYSEGDELKVTAAPQNWNYEDDSDTAIIITVPKDYRFESVEIEVKSVVNHGRTNSVNHVPSVYAEGLKAGKLEIDAKVGYVEIVSADVGILEAESDVGSISYKGRVSGNIDGECNVGALALELKGHESDYNYEIKCRVGSVRIDGESYSGLSGKKMINNNAAKKMELECRTGGITVEFDDTI